MSLYGISDSTKNVGFPRDMYKRGEARNGLFA